MQLNGCDCLDESNGYANVYNSILTALNDHALDPWDNTNPAAAAHTYLLFDNRMPP